MQKRRTNRKRGRSQNGLFGDFLRGAGRAARKTGRGYVKLAKATHRPKWDAAAAGSKVRGRRASDKNLSGSPAIDYTDAQIRQMIKDRSPLISARPHRKNPSRGAASNPGQGRMFQFHGSFQKKSDAVRKEQATPGSFIKFVLTRSGGRFLVMSRNETKLNPAQRRRVKNVAFGEFEKGIFHPWTRKAIRELRPAKLGKRRIPRNYSKHGRSRAVSAKRKNPVAEYQAAKHQWEQARQALKMARTPAERRAADHDIEFWGNKMAHYSGAVVQFRKANPRKKARARKRNGNLSDAAELYRQFHGREATKLTDVLQRIVSRDAYAGLGTLVRLVVDGAISIDFPETDRDSVMVASDPKGRQLFLIGGDQDVTPLLNGRKGVDRTKDLIDLGELRGMPGAKDKFKSIEYFTRKKMDNFKAITYVHEFGEESGVRPRLMYDRLNKQLHIVGGNYQVKPEGIVD